MADAITIMSKAKGEVLEPFQTCSIQIDLGTFCILYLHKAVDIINTG